MKIDTSKVKKGTILKIEGNLYKITDISHTHMARGGATYNFKVKDIVSGKTNNFTYNSGTILEEAEVNMQNAIYLYKGGDNYSFMENDTGEIHEVQEDKIEDIVGYLKENLDVFLMMYQGNVIGVVLPATIQYKITSTVPGVKGDRASSGTKPATLETGIEIQVPLHKNEGDTITLNTINLQAS